MVICNIYIEPTEVDIPVKPRKGSKINPDMVRSKLREKTTSRIIIDGPRGIGKSATL